MADRYDPRLSVRAVASDRKYSEMNPGEKTDHDPLVELARIVSGRGATGGGASARRPPAAAQVGAGQLGDLEAELLNDLQASFTAVKDMTPATPARPAVVPPPPPTPSPAAASSQSAPALPAKAADGVVRDRLTDALAALAPVLKFERPSEGSAPTPPSAPVIAFPDNRLANPNAQGSGAGGPGGEPIMAASTANRLRDAFNALAPAAQPVPSAEGAFARLDGDRSALRAVPASVEPVDPPPASERQLRVAAQVDRIDLPNLHLRASQVLSEGRSRPHSRWEKPAEPAKAAAGASRFAPPRTNAAPAPVVSPPEEDDELFATSPFAALQGAQPESPSEPRAEELELPEVVIDDEIQADPDFSGYMRRRAGRRRLLASVVGVGVLAVGGIAFAMLRNGPVPGLTPIFTDAGGPSKVAAAPGAVDQTTGKLNYESVGTTNNGATKLVTSQTQIASVPSADTGSGAIGDLINGAGGGAAPGIDSAIDPQTNEPRKVRTVVVRPDGTIVSSDATEAPATPATTASSTAPAVRQIVPNSVGTQAVTAGAPAPAAPPSTPQRPAVSAPTTAPASGPTPAKPSVNETLNVAGAGAGNAPNGELLITPNASPGARPATTPSATASNTSTGAIPPKAATPSPAAANTATAIPSKPVTTTTVTAPPASTAPPAPAPAPVTIAQAPTAAKPATTPLATLPSGGPMVQMSSQRTEDGARATFKDLQVRYAKILGAYEVNIQRADLGEKGVFYRARVGPFSSADAKRLCDDLKAVGGDCLLVTSN
jgi:hypothetical protein